MVDFKWPNWLLRNGTVLTRCRTLSLISAVLLPRLDSLQAPLAILRSILGWIWSDFFSFITFQTYKLWNLVFYFSLWRDTEHFISIYFFNRHLCKWYSESRFIYFLMRISYNYLYLWSDGQKQRNLGRKRLNSTVVLPNFSALVSGTDTAIVLTVLATRILSFLTF